MGAQWMKNRIVQLLAGYQEGEIEFDAPRAASTPAGVSAPHEDSALIALVQSRRCVGRLQENVPVVFPNLCHLPNAKGDRNVILILVVIELPRGVAQAHIPLVGQISNDERLKQDLIGIALHGEGLVVETTDQPFIDGR